MGSLSAKEAAAQVGMTKAGIIKSIRTGKISAKKKNNGEWDIEPAELFRVYPPVNLEHMDKNNKVDVGTQVQLIGLQAEISGLKALLETVKDERDDLRERLTAESEERRKLTAMITDQRPQGLFSRLFGNGRAA